MLPDSKTSAGPGLIDNRELSGIASTSSTAISVKGRIINAPSTVIENRRMAISGSFPRIASIVDEEWMEGEPVPDPELFRSRLAADPTKPDLFAFSQKLLETKPKHPYYHEWDNVAAVRIVSYEDWSAKLSQETRRNVRLAGKRGVEVRLASFDDDLIRGIVDLYNETPVRQGRPFWHFGKGFQAVQAENASFAERSLFIGAYLKAELVGFVKIVFVDDVASIMQILCKLAHQDKRPMNALIAKAIEICATKGKSHLLYRKYFYYKDRADALTEFKRRNGFECVMVPRYFVPLTATGRFALRLRLHRGIKNLLPTKVVNTLLAVRKTLADWRSSKTAVSEAH